MGTGGLAPTFGAPGLLATGGGVGFGFVDNGGAFGAVELAGAGTWADPFVDVDDVFFHGAAEPLEGAIPGKTATGLAEGSATIDFTAAFADGATGAVGAGAIEGGRRFAGSGGGGGAGVALGTNSR